MVNTCCVPRCRSNKNAEDKISTFSFPKDAVLKGKWLRAICRKDFVPSKFYKVCILHFAEHSIRRNAEGFDPKSGKKLVVPLEGPRLVKDAVKTLLPNCPGYLSKKSTFRLSREEKLEAIENEQLAKSIQKSLKSKEPFDKKNLFITYSQLKEILTMEEFAEPWNVIMRNSSI